MIEDFKPLTVCLACGGEHLVDQHPDRPWIPASGQALVPFLSLGAQSLANSFHDGSQDLPTYPLGLQVCPSCHHSQQLVSVKPELLFTDYPYVSGTSDTLKAYFSEFVEKVEKAFPEGNSLRVLEIGSNDGTLLREFMSRPALHSGCGVDPNASPDIISYFGYWGREAIDHLHLSEGVDVIVAMNVLAHTDDPYTFLMLCKEVLAPGGRIYVQFSQRHMLERCEFDTVYHEHISFFEPSSFLALLHRVGLKPESHREVEVHGGSSLWEISGDPPNPAVFPHDFSYWVSVHNMAQYEAFGDRAEKIKREFKNACVQAVMEGYALIGYGAAAKANTFLNFTGVRLDYILDENPLKIGKLTPGSNISVCTPSMVKDHHGKVMFIIMAWNFKDEIERKIRELRPDHGDKFMVYYPEMSVWS